jgi:uncharacterized protein with GYD domain
MPHNWVELSNTPPPWNEVSGDPTKYRDAIERTVEHYGGRLVEMFWSVGRHTSFALIDGPGDPVRTKAMLKALPSLGLTTLLDHSETRKAFDHVAGAPNG